MMSIKLQQSVHVNAMFKSEKIMNEIEWNSMEK